MMRKVIVSPSREGLLVRKPNGNPYKTAEEVVLNTSVARDLRSGDLVLVKKTKSKPKTKPTE